MKTKTPLEILNTRNASKYQLRAALAQALCVDLPDFGEEPPKSLFVELRDVFCNAYYAKTGIEYRFAARDGKALKELQAALVGMFPDKERDTFAAMLENLPEFYRTKAFTLSAINNNLNAIIASIRTDGTKQGASSSYTERLAATLRGE